MHHNRHNIGKFWPIPRKGTKYLARSSHNQNDSIPLIVVLRDVLKIVNSKKELKKAINEKEIVVNGKEIRDVSFPISLFDVVKIKSMGKSFKAVLSENKKLMLGEVDGKDAVSKVYKVIGKKIIAGGKVQINLLNGRNVFVEGKDKVRVGDSMVVGFDGKVISVIGMEKGNMGFVTHGKHMGDRGKIKDIGEQGGKMIAKIEGRDHEINVWVKNVIVIE